MIGIICVMDEEVISLKRKLLVRKQREIAGMTFFEGTIEEKEVVAVRCGVGKVDAAICTQILVDLFNVKYIINTGVASGLYPKLNIGDVIIASDVTETDVEKSYAETNSKLIRLAEEAAGKLKGEHKIYTGRVASDDQFICGMRVKEDIYTTFTSYCAEMEGAAVAHTCYLNKIPFVMLRVISDTVDPACEINFEDFVDTVTRNISRMIKNIVMAI